MLTARARGSEERGPGGARTEGMLGANWFFGLGAKLLAEVEADIFVQLAEAGCDPVTEPVGISAYESYGGAPASILKDSADPAYLAKRYAGASVSDAATVKWAAINTLNHVPGTNAAHHPLPALSMGVSDHESPCFLDREKG